MHADHAPALPDARLDAAFEAAKRACLTGHAAGCTYGGTSPADGYWLAAAHCPRRHARECALCGRPATTSFVGWQDLRIWGVTACRACAELYLAAHPDLEQPDTGGRVLDRALAHAMARFANDIRDDLNAAAQHLQAQMIGELPPARGGPKDPRGLSGLLHAVDEPGTRRNAAADPRALYGGLPPHPLCLDPHLPVRTEDRAPSTFWAGKPAFDARMRQLITSPRIGEEHVRRIADGLLALADAPGSTPGRGPRGEAW